MELPYNEYIWFSPRFAIKYLSDLMRKEGINEVLKDSKYKKEREAWIMGVSLFGYMKLSNAKWWLQVPKDDPPDMRAMTMVPDYEKNLHEMLHREVEIMQITKHTTGSIVEEILKKLKGKSYIKETALLVYLQRTMLIADMRELANELNKAKPNVADIWILASTSPVEQKYILFSLYPDMQRVDYDIDEEIKNLEPGDSLDLIPRTKGTTMTLVKNARRTKFIPD